MVRARRSPMTQTPPATGVLASNMAVNSFMKTQRPPRLVARNPREKIRVFLGFLKKKSGTPEAEGTAQYPAYSKFEKAYDSERNIQKRAEVVQLAFAHLFERRTISQEELKLFLSRMDSIPRNQRWVRQIEVEILYGLCSLRLKYSKGGSEELEHQVLTSLDKIKAKFHPDSLHTVTWQFGQEIWMPGQGLSNSMRDWDQFRGFIVHEFTLGNLRRAYEANNTREILKEMGVIREIFSSEKVHSAYSRMAAIAFVYHLKQRTELSVAGTAIGNELRKAKLLAHERTVLEKIMTGNA